MGVTDWGSASAVSDALRLCAEGKHGEASVHATTFGPHAISSEQWDGVIAAVLAAAKNPPEVTVGAEVIGDWGAMFPSWKGKITQGGNILGWLVEWEYPEGNAPSWHTVKPAVPLAGSPIGVFLRPGNA